MPKVQLSDLSMVHLEASFSQIDPKVPGPTKTRCGETSFIATTITLKRVTCPKCLKFAPHREVANAEAEA